MPRTCTVCGHPERTIIDATLVAGRKPLRTIADRWSVSKTALIRHKVDHLPAHLPAVHDSPAGRWNAALVALLYGGGLWRSEAAALDG